MNTVSMLNPTQRMLLETFAGVRDDKEMEEISLLLRDYFARKLEDAIDGLHDDGTLSDEKLDALRQTHLRTAYSLR